MADGKVFEETVVALSLLCRRAGSRWSTRALTSDRPELLPMLLEGHEVQLGDGQQTIIGLFAPFRSLRQPFDLEHCLASYERIKLATAQQAVRYHWGGRQRVVVQKFASLFPRVHQANF